jgi:hypothetical protein
MTENEEQKKVTIDGTEYLLADLSEPARVQIAHIQFIDQQLQQLNNELAVSDTARLGYTAALQREVPKVEII